MLPVSRLSHYSIPMGLLLFFLSSLFTPSLSYAEEISLQSLSMRARFSEATVLGKDSPESFEAYDVSANFTLPWKNYSDSGWGVGTRLMASAGILRGNEEDALVGSLIPELTLGSEDERYILDLGIGGALLSRHRFEEQDYGGAFQFALTAGVTVPIYKKLQIGYRFMHYSDGAVHGSDTTGVDLHMIEFGYRY